MLAQESPFPSSLDRANPRLFPLYKTITSVMSIFKRPWIGSEILELYLLGQK